MNKVRCAIYTRKSSEEGLEQSFNSLDAQREACGAYILSQASEGWTAVPEEYDDGGLSGGSLERPALQRLLSDIESGRVDIVVVYKVDRLTRSLLDFAKLVEAFDNADVSFVSVTQSFNTTTSMGRLTLNMLLSFAQFEREVTAERIRDKIAASKAKGMWMGGLPPLGYEPDGRSLRIVPEHAATVRRIYERYLALSNVRLLDEELARGQVVAPPRTLGTGRAVGGRPFSRGHLYAILGSPIYAGDIPHKGTVHPGLHEAIIDRGTWEQVQAKLSQQVKGQRRGRRSDSLSPAWRQGDRCCRQNLQCLACLQGSTALPLLCEPTRGSGAVAAYSGSGARGRGRRVSANVLADPAALCARAWLEVAPEELAGLADRAAAQAARLQKRDGAALRELVSCVRVHEDRIEVDCDTEALAEALGVKLADDAGPTLQLEAEVRLQRSGRAVRLVQESGAGLEASPCLPLIGLLLKARRWWALLHSSEVDVTRLAEREGVTASYLTRVVRLALLSPAVVEAILSGRTKASVDGYTLTGTGAILPDWGEQARVLLPAARG